MDDLITLAKSAIRAVINSEGVPGLLGKANGDIAYVDPSGAVARNKCWARIGAGSSATELVVNCSNVPQQVNLPVIIANRDGVPTAIRTDTARAETFAGGRPMTVPNHNWTHDRLSADPLYITGLAFLPLQAHPTIPADLTVTVEQSFYRYQGAEYLFPLTVSASLSSYVPASGHHFILLCLDRSTNTLAVVDGGSSVAPVSGNPFTPGNVLTYVDTLAASYYPICAIWLQAGQTTITAQSIFMDLRFWGGEVGAIDTETVQDIIGAILVDTATIDFTYSDATPSISAIVIDDSITNAKLRNSGALSVIGRSANSTGDPADISAIAASDAVFRESGSALGFGTVATGGIANDAITNVKLANMATKTYKGRTSGSTGDPEDVAAATVAADIQASVDHGSIAGLGDDDHTQYALLLGRSGGQTLIGGTGAGDDLTLKSSSNATRGTIFFGNAATTVFDDVNNRIGIQNASPAAPLHVGAGADATVTTAGNILIYASRAGTSAFVLRDETNDCEMTLIASSTIGVFGTATNQDVRIRSNNTDVVTIDTSSQVGIQRTSPQAMLHVGAGADAPGSANTNIYASNAGAVAIVARDSTNNVEAKLYANTGDVEIGAHTNHALLLLVNNAEKARIDTSGQLGIGVTPGGFLSVKAGTSTDYANVGGVIYQTTTQTGNVGTGEDDLASFSVPANTLGVNGQSIWFEASGTYAANGNNKTLRIRFGTSGTNLIMTNGPSAFNNRKWVVRGRVVRTGAATQKGYAFLLLDGGGNEANVVTGLDQTLSGAVTFKITGEATSNNDILLETMTVGYSDQNS